MSLRSRSRSRAAWLDRLVMSGATWFFIDTTGSLHVEAGMVHRARHGRTECLVASMGSSCAAGDATIPGVVDRGVMIAFGEGRAVGGGLVRARRPLRRPAPPSTPG